MPELPWVQWYPTNWASEPGLRLCEAATRGIWFEAVNTMFLQGVGSISGTIEQLAAMCACRIPQMELAIRQLKEFKVADVVEQNVNTLYEQNGNRVEQQNVNITLTCRKISRDLKIKELRRKAGLASATKRQHTVNTVYPTPSVYASTSTSASSSKGVRRGTGNLRGDSELPAWEHVKSHAVQIGLAEWKAKDFFDSMDAIGWKDKNGNAVVNWKAYLSRIKTWWEADGRPMQPGNHKPKQNTISLENELKRIDAELKTIRDGTPKDAMGGYFWDLGDKMRLDELKERRAEILKQIGATA